jgi:hypothetical protein
MPDVRIAGGKPWKSTGGRFAPGHAAFDRLAIDRTRPT